MKELSREEEIKDIELIIENENTHFAAIEIMDLLKPLEIKAGMWGKFWDRERYEYSALDRHEPGDMKGCYYRASSQRWYNFFKHIPGLKEAIEELEEIQR